MSANSKKGMAFSHEAELETKTWKRAKTNRRCRRRKRAG